MEPVPAIRVDTLTSDHLEGDPMRNTMTGRCALALLGSVAAIVGGASLIDGSMTPAPAQAQTRTSVSVDFHAVLDPHGRWERHSRWGEVWLPAHRPRDWRPYTDGHWAYTEEWGWYWISAQDEEDWGWVAFHYGRWVFDPDLGWVWIPRNEWGPGWVDWRRGGNRVGWAPLPPDDSIGAAAGIASAGRRCRPTRSWSRSRSSR